ncbi:hypothetical protein BK133_02470 [Paenibacillus sp. FSL H8-0548]|uniref:nitrite reductase large subunit NirB n=1 Tax=Paenibacillus sp. FSL H8-0548 TaxID=1920422 RepID=UPI00096E80BC|nr:nitrite reductase large subunit NirB [Paenibacillus sp. FSL H8-0548]OMF38406.1 hypothetical protein BK133_02470 [Paenibacillus sp. FSL H8-0548]
MSREKLIVIGNGMAGIKCLDEIIKLSPSKFQITVFGSEKHPNYNRILLSKVLQGDSSIDSIVINDWSWYEERNIRLFTGETVVQIDTNTKQVTTLSGICAEYDHLIIATGSSAFIPPITGVHKSGVISFRSMEDCATMFAYAKKYKRAAVIGGGLLGLEAARGLLNLGMQTEVIHNAPYLMNRQLDVIAADMLRKELEQQGMRFSLSKETESIIGLNRAKGIRFTNGSTIEADLIVISVGIRPNIALAKQSGIETNRAIIVDDYMRTSVPSIYAVGECAEHRGVAYGLVAPLYEQGKVLAGTLCGNHTEPYTGSIPYAQLKVSGVEVFSVGQIQSGEADTAIQIYDGIHGTYKKVTMKDGKVSGAILFGQTSEGTALLGLVKRGAPVAELTTAKADDQSDSDHIVASMSDRETVCACNAVNKSAIMCAVMEDGLQSVEQVRDRTKASSSCGGCRPMVEAIVRYALSHDREAGALIISPICSCAEISHDMLKAYMKTTHDHSINKIREELGSIRLGECSLCLSAIRYYSALYYPNSKEVNAAIAGGTKRGRNHFSVDVHSGSEKDTDAHFHSSYVGSQLKYYCTDLPFPAPVRAAVASSIHISAGVLVHDVGICGSPAGWEVYAGGHAEHPVKQGQLIGIADSDRLAVELFISCLQLYRENAEFGEPLWKWIEREGLANIRESVLDLDYRIELVEQAAATITNKSDERLGESLCGN